ncbi:hypothetical protein FS749_011440 [Ceratobasidium sp. UAMH 11750]|nr:hypothetical protein FS749_011440 [Ceratobasidium sp. UAMH 11750]
MSKHYTEPTTLNKGRVWFTVEEELWLNRWRPEVQRLNNLEGGKVKKAQTEFYTTLVADFLKNFPYRDPDNNPDWVFTPAQKQLAMSSKDRQSLRNRMRSKLRGPDKEPPDSTAQTPHPKTPDTPIPSPPTSPAPTEATVPTEDIGRERGVVLQDEEMRDRFDGNDPLVDRPGPFDLEAQLRMAGPQYRTSAEDLAESRDLIKRLIKMGNTSWAEVEETELRGRQRQLMPTVRAVMHLLSHATGAELCANVVWHDGSEIVAGVDVTDCAHGFVQSEEARPAFTTKVEHAVARIFGDPYNNMRPTIPTNLIGGAHWKWEREIQRTLLQLLWGKRTLSQVTDRSLRAVWHGGKLPMPWARLQADGELGHYHLIERCHLPDGVTCLRDPRMFDEAETNLWAEVLRSPNRTGSRSFRYRQPAPGLIYGPGSSVVPQPNAVRFPPDSLLFVRRQTLDYGSLDGRWGGLPMIPAKPPVVLGGATLEWAVDAAKDSEAMRDLVEYVQAVEAFGPHQAWGLDAVLRWIDGPAFVHRDGTLICGQLGFKWSALLLLHLYCCGTGTAKGCGPHGPSYTAVQVEWSQANTEAVINCAVNLLTRIAETVYHLGRTAHERQGSSDVDTPRGDPARFVFTESIDPVDEWTAKNVAVTAGPPNVPTRALTQPAPKKRSRDGLAARDQEGQSSTSKSNDSGAPGKRARSAAEPGASAPPPGEATRKTSARRTKGVQFSLDPPK